MPCSICGHVLVYYEDEEMCPECKGLAMLDLKTSIKVASRLVKMGTKIFNDELATWERDTLLGNLVAKRELLARAFFKEFSVLDVGKLTAYTVLIRKAVKFSGFTGRVPKAEGDTEKLLRLCEGLMDFESWVLDIESGYRNILYLKKFDPENFTLDDAKETFRLVVNESYLRQEKTFEMHDIYPKEKADKKIEEYMKDYTPLGDSAKYEFIPPDEYIRKHYQILNGMFVLFHRDKLSAECFDLEYLDEVLNEPRDLVEFVSTFRLFEDNTITICPTNIFVKRASIYFNIPENKAKRMFVFDVNNKSIFPLFVRFRNESLGDVVCISKDFSSFVYTILHAIITKQLFDEETVRLSKEFENERVKVKFEEHGFMYARNVIDKKKASLEIDGIGIKENVCYVIECKGWRFPRLVAEPNTRDHIIRDLKGVVLGEEYTYKEGALKIRNKPSLIEKIDYVKKNTEIIAKRYNLDFAAVTDYKGLIVTIDYPPILEFKGIRMFSLNEIQCILET